MDATERHDNLSQQFQCNYPARNQCRRILPSAAMNQIRAGCSRPASPRRKRYDKLLGRRAGRSYNPLMVHVGIGYDVHQLVAGRRLVLGGVEIPHTKGLDGHSDADALMHAICDAVLGALGEADIGHFFPNTDPRWKGVSSNIFLEAASKQAAKRGGKIVNVDATVIAQAPKIYPHIAEMKKRIADTLGLREVQVGVKATTNELMGFIGREEGISSFVVAFTHHKTCPKLKSVGSASPRTVRNCRSMPST